MQADQYPFDADIRPADDFFRYANGRWIAENPIPPDESRWGSFDVLRNEVEEQLHRIVDDFTAAASAGRELDRDERRIRDFYATGMNQEARNRQGMAPLADIFRKIDDISDLGGLAAALGSLHRIGIGAWWAPSSEQDERKSEVVALHLYQGGLGLPDRDYYVADDEPRRKIRADYLVYVQSVLARINSPEAAESDREAAAATAAAGIMELETALAQSSLTRVELRDVEKQYHKMTLAELAALAPRVDWPRYFDAIGLGNGPEYVIVGQPKFFAEVDRLFESVPLERVKTYLQWHVLRRMAGCLSEDMERAAFDFYGRTFGGATEMKPAWRRVLGAANDLLDEMIGKQYVKRHFSEDAKQKIRKLVDHLAAAYRTRIERLDWMGAETKRKAIEKLEAVSRKLGYPDVWRDMAALEIGAESYAENVMRATAFEFDRKMREVGGAVNRDEWFMPPQMVNAYYQPPLNEIAFPAAILQPPFFDPAAPEAVNFGGIGTVIGHELTHGLDDQGSLFDARGNLSRWWTPEDKERFDAKAARLADQFDRYEPLPGVHVNGKLTLGENIADLGGIAIALDGLALALAADPQADWAEAVRMFFINYAVTERGHAREAYRRLALQVDPHSPSEYRVNGPLSNTLEFYEVFALKEGDGLWREPGERVAIW